MENVIAHRELVGIDSSNVEFEIHVRIGTPFQKSDHDWRCFVEIAGLHGKVMEVQDIDSFSALRQAIGLAYHFLERHEEAGGKLLWAFNRVGVSTTDDVF